MGRGRDGHAGGPPPAEEVFAERVARLVGLVERWYARVETERWPAVPLSGLERDNPRRVAAELRRECGRSRS